MFNEIIQLHPPTAKYLLENNIEYHYEYYLSAYSRVDFYSKVYYEKSSLRWEAKNDQFYEVGNAYTNKSQVVAKVTQIIRYIEDSNEAEAFLVVPHHKIEGFTEELCSLFGISVIYIKPITLNFSYTTFYNRVVAKSANYKGQTPNISAFTKLGFSSRFLHRRYLQPSLILK